jgi:sugar phosphate isomerase/epimerase
MESAKALNSPLLCADIGPLPEPARTAAPRTTIAPEQAGLIIIPSAPRPANHPPEPEVKADAAFESHIDAVLREIGHHADRIGVILAIRSELSSFAAMSRALRAADCPWFGVDLDPAAMLIDRWSVDEVFSALAPVIRHVRGRDAHKGHDRRTRPAMVGKGNVNWGEVRALLDEAGYSGWITVDPTELPDRIAAARAALAQLA